MEIAQGIAYILYLALITLLPIYALYLMLSLTWHLIRKAQRRANQRKRP